MICFVFFFTNLNRNKVSNQNEVYEEICMFGSLNFHVNLLQISHKKNQEQFHIYIHIIQEVDKGRNNCIWYNENVEILLLFDVLFSHYFVSSDTYTKIIFGKGELTEKYNYIIVCMEIHVLKYYIL